MAFEKDRIEELMKQLPEEQQNEVLRFVESLVDRNRPRAGGNVITKGASSTRERSDEAIKEALSVRSFFGTWESGDPRSADNDRIDADLVRAYTNSHETE